MRGISLADGHDHQAVPAAEVTDAMQTLRPAMGHQHAVLSTYNTLVWHLSHRVGDAQYPQFWL